jgi:hypothetical protein
MSEIPATQEAEIRGLQFKANPGKIKRPYLFGHGLSGRVLF